MDWYFLAKLFHVITAIVWLGGGFSLTMLAIRAERANNDADLLRVVEDVVYLSPRVIVPASALTLIFGVIMVVLGQSFTDFWIVLGLFGFAITFTIGVGVIKPVTDRIAETVAKEGASPDAIATGKRLLQFVKFDMVLLYTIVAVMVLKPTASDVGLLTVMGAILTIAAFAFLGRRRGLAAAGA